MPAKVFPIIPASATPFWVILGILILFLALSAFFIFIAYSARHLRCELNGGGLRVRGGIYGRFLPKDSLIKENAKILNLGIDTEYQPRIRTNGIGLPGYKEGWFKLKNGERALLFITDVSRVVYIPTKKGYSVLLSTHQPEELLKSMDEVWKD